METRIQITLKDKLLTQSEQQELWRDISNLLEEKELDSCITFHRKI